MAKLGILLVSLAINVLIHVLSIYADTPGSFYEVFIAFLLIYGHMKYEFREGA